jgi:hypothetical protein
MSESQKLIELAKRIENTPIGPFAILLGMSDDAHFNDIVEARGMIVLALRARAAIA